MVITYVSVNYKYIVRRTKFDLNQTLKAAVEFNSYLIPFSNV